MFMWSQIADSSSLLVEITLPSLDLILYEDEPSLVKRRVMIMLSPYSSCLYASSPWFLRVTETSAALQTVRQVNKSEAGEGAPLTLTNEGLQSSASSCCRSLASQGNGQAREHSTLTTYVLNKKNKHAKNASSRTSIVTWGTFTLAREI